MSSLRNDPKYVFSPRFSSVRMHHRKKTYIIRENILMNGNIKSSYNVYYELIYGPSYILSVML
jgi:hypothetical protein